MTDRLKTYKNIDRHEKRQTLKKKIPVTFVTIFGAHLINHYVLHKNTYGYKDRRTKKHSQT
jgi:hypothetical protein